MTPILFLVIAIGGGIGAVLRFLVDGVIRSKTSVPFPLGTMVINVSGSLLLGFVTALAVGAVIPDELRLVVGTGILGGYTTFSTASVETVRLLEEHRYRAALINGLGMLVAGVAAAALGYWLGTLI